MTKEELREKRNLAIENLNHAIAILGSDELYIDELEKENLYYKDIVETNSAEWEEQGQRVVALEKENAELKAKNKWYSEQVCNKECAEVWGNLDKAKEIIKTFLGFAEAFGYSPSMDKFISEAKQFISEEEK